MFFFSANEENIRQDSERELPLPNSCHKSENKQLCIPITSNFRLLRNISIVITNKRLVLLLPIRSNYVEMINTPATKLLILVSFRYVKNN